MKPFDHTTIHSPDIKYYNYRLSIARIISENASGYLQARWYHLLKQNDFLIENAPHNLCKIHGDSFDSDWLDQINNPLHLRIFTFSYLYLFSYVCLSLSCTQSLAPWPYLNMFSWFFKSCFTHWMRNTFIYRLVPFEAFRLTLYSVISPYFFEFICLSLCPTSSNFS